MKINSIQFLRGIASMLVLFYHISGNVLIKYGQPNGDAYIYKLFTSGLIGVDIFFIISGFIMYYTIYISGKNTLSTKTFLIKRSIRIAPLYWFYTIIYAGAALLIPTLTHTDRITSEAIFKSFAFIPYYDNVIHGYYPIIFLCYFRACIVFQKMASSINNDHPLFCFNCVFPERIKRSNIHNRQSYIV